MDSKIKGKTLRLKMITKRPDSSLDILLTYLYNIVYFYINFYFMQHTDKKLDNLHSKFFFIRNTK